MANPKQEKIILGLAVIAVFLGFLFCLSYVEQKYRIASLFSENKDLTRNLLHQATACLDTSECPDGYECYYGTCMNTGGGGGGGGGGFGIITAGGGGAYITGGG